MLLQLRLPHLQSIYYIAYLWQRYRAASSTGKCSPSWMVSPSCSAVGDFDLHQQRISMIKKTETDLAVLVVEVQSRPGVVHRRVLTLLNGQSQLFRRERPQRPRPRLAARPPRQHERREARRVADALGRVPKQQRLQCSALSRHQHRLACRICARRSVMQKRGKPPCGGTTGWWTGWEP